MNKKFKKTIQDTFVSPDAMRKEEFFRNAENLAEVNKINGKRNIPMIYRLSAAVMFTAAAIGIGIGLNTVKPPDRNDHGKYETSEQNISASVTTSSENSTAPAETTAVTEVRETAKNEGKTSSIVQTSVTQSVSKKSAVSASTVKSTGNAVSVTTASNTDPNEIKTYIPMSKEDEIIMKKRVSEILAAFTASIMTGSAVLPNIGYADTSLEGINKFEHQAVYDEIGTHELDFDIDGNGVFDYMDPYYGFVYCYDPIYNTLPKEYVEKIEKNFDLNGDGIISQGGSEIYSIAKYYYDKYIKGDKELLFELDRKEYGYTNELRAQQNYLTSLYYGDVDDISSEYNNALYLNMEKEVVNSFDFDVNSDGSVDAFDMYKLISYWYCVYSDYSFECSEDKGYVAVPDLSLENRKKVGFIKSEDTFRNEYLIEIQDYFKNNKIFREMAGMNDAEWSKCGKFFDDLSAVEYYNYHAISAETADFLLGVFYSYNPTDAEMTKKEYYDEFNPTYCLDEMDYRDHKQSTMGYDFNAGFAEMMSSAFGKYRKHIDDPFEGQPTKLDSTSEDFGVKFNELFEKTKADVASGKIAPPDVNFDGKCNSVDYLLSEMYVTAVLHHRTAENCMMPVETWNYIDTQLDYNNDGISGDWYDIMLIESMALVCGGSWNDEIDLEFTEYYNKLASYSDSVTLDTFMSKFSEEKTVGDVNLDGKISAVDASAVLIYYAESSADEDVNEVKEQRMSLMGDFNGDGTVDARDASGILRRYAELSVQ